jgi:hypothetical protein
MVPLGRQTQLSLRRADLESRFPGLLQSILAAYERDARLPQARAEG